MEGLELDFSLLVGYLCIAGSGFEALSLLFLAFRFCLCKCGRQALIGGQRLAIVHWEPWDAYASFFGGCVGTEPFPKRMSDGDRRNNEAETDHRAPLRQYMYLAASLSLMMTTLTIRSIRSVGSGGKSGTPVYQQRAAFFKTLEGTGK